MFANKKLLTTMCPGDAYAPRPHTHSQPLFLRLCMILFLSLVGMGSAWATSFIPTTTKAITQDVTYYFSDFATGIDESWINYAAKGNDALSATTNKKPTFLDGSVSSTNLSCLQVKADGGVFNSNKRVLHFRVTGVASVKACGYADSGRGFQIGATEVTNDLTENTEMAVVAGYTSAQNPVSYSNLDPQKEYVISIFAYSSDTFLYAVSFETTSSPSPTTYTVTYDGNGNTGGSVPTDATNYASGASVTVLGNTGSLIKTDYTFDGWNTAANGSGTNYAAGANFSISANTTLYAKWMENAPVSADFTMATPSPDPSVIGDMEVSGGSISDKNSATKALIFNGNGVNFPGSAAQLLITLNKKIQVGTSVSISYKNTSGDKTTGLGLFDKNVANQVINLTNISSGSSGTEIYTFTGSNTSYIGSNQLVITRNSGTGGLAISRITITNLGAEATTYTITYDMNGHGDQIAQVASATNLPNPLPVPTATGWDFGGWYTDSGLTSAAVAGAALAANTTLYAKWTAEAVDPAHIDDWDQTYSNQTNGKKGFTAEPTFVNGKVVFAPNVRYSKYVINSRINKYGESTNSNNHGFGVFTEAGALVSGSANEPKNPKDNIHYVPGFVAQGILEAIDYYRTAEGDAGENFNIKPWFYAVQNWGITYDMSDGTKKGNELDGMSAVKIYSLLKKFAINETFSNGSQNSNAATTTAANNRFSDALKALKTYNTTRVITSSTNANAAGGWWHKSTYDNEMWCDGQYMGPATLAHIINDAKGYTKVASTGTDWDLINNQINISWNYLWNSTDRLLYHGFSATPSSDTWATVPCSYDNTCSTNPAYWSRGDSWYVLALVDILQQMDRTSEKGGSNYNNLKEKLNTLIDGIVARQDATSGVWYQVINKNATTLTGNYLESSASAIFLTAIMRAQRLGYLTNDYTIQIKKGYEGFVNNFLVSDNEGGINIINCSCSASLKAGTGTEAYYARETGTGSPQPAIDYTEGKALGAFIMAAVEYERLYLEEPATNTHLVKFNPAGGTATVMAGSTDITAEATNGTGAQVEDGTKVVITVTPADKAFKNWKNILTGTTTSTTYFDGTSYKYTIASLTEDVDLNVKFEAKKEFDVPSDPAILFQVDVTSNDQLTLAPRVSSTTTDLRNYATVVGAVATLHNGNSTNDALMTYARQVNLAGSSASYLKIDLGEDKTFAAGDIITFGSNEQMKLGATDDYNNTIKSTGGTYTVQESDGIAGCRYLYIFKDGQDAGGSAAFRSLLITRGALKQNITRFSPKGGTVKNTLYAGEYNYPDLYIAPFTSDNVALSKADFTITSSDETVATVEWHDGVDNGITNTLNGNMRTIHLTVKSIKAGTARINITFNGNSEFNEYPTFIDYVVTEPCTVTYNANTGSNAPANSANVAVGGNVTAAEAGEMTKTGYEFVGWNTAADGSGTAYAPGDAITLEANVTLYAQWKNTAERVLYSYTVTDGQLAVTDAEAIGGTFTSTKKEDSQEYGIKLDFNNDATHYIKLNLNTALAAGDKIRLTMHQTSTSGPDDKYGIGFANSPTAETNLYNFTIPTANGKNTVTYEYTVASEGLAGMTELYLGRLNGNTGVYFEAVEIVRTVAAGTDATIKNVMINNHNIAESNGSYDYSIGSLYGQATIPVTITPNDASAKVNGTATTDGKVVVTATVGEELTVTITAADNTTTETYKVNVGMALDRPQGTLLDKYAVENITYYEGQKMNANNVSMWYSLSAGSDNQLSFPVSANTNPVDATYQYRIVNGNGASPVYDTTTGVPTSGAYYKVQPDASGMLTVAVQLNADKPLIISNGAKIFVAGTDFQYDLRSMADGSALTMSGNKVSENAMGTVTFSVSAKDYYIYAGGSKLGLMGFGLDTTIPTYNVKAVATTGGSVSINSGAITSGTNVNAGTVIDIVATPNTGYKFTGWTNASGDIVSTLSTYHIDALNANVDLTANFAATGIVTAHATFPLDVMKQFGAANGDMVNTFYDTGYPTTTHVTLATSSNNVQAQNSSKGTKVRPDGSFTLTPATGMKIKSIELVTDQTTRHINCDADAEPSNDGSTWTYSMNADGTVTFTNNSGGNIYVTAINVTYEYQAGAETKQYLGSFPANSAITDYVGKTAQLPAVNVTDDGVAVASGDYTVTYESTNESVATVSETGLVTLVGAGSASIKAIITPNDGAILGSTATVAVTSLALRTVNVSMADLTVNSNDGEYTMPKPVVTIGSATLAANEYTVSYAKKSGADVAAMSGSQISLVGEAYNWTVGTEVITVTVTPTVAARQQYNSEANGSADFTIMVVKAGGKTIPNIEFPDEITLNTGITNNQLVAHVNYNGVDITSGFTLSYTIKSNTGSNATITDGDKLNTGATDGTAVFTITATPKKDVTDEQYDSNTKDITVHIKSLTPMVVTPEMSDQMLTVGHTFTTPAITVTAGGLVLDLGDEYTITYSSSAKSVASIDANGKVTALAEGTATITILVSDVITNPANKQYQDAVLTYTVTVNDPAVFKAPTSNSAKDYKRGKILSTGDGKLNVTLGGWIFPNTVSGAANQQNYGTSNEDLGGSANWPGEPSKSNFTPEGFNALIAFGTNKNPRNEYGNNSQPQSEHVYNGTLIEQSSTVIDPMFNVPCTGSYLVFEPKTNGTISATIMQNGVFDVAGGDPVYRPQRRVFVLDETGTLIQSTPKLEVTSGKFEKPDKDHPEFDTKDFTKYGWDIDVQPGEVYHKIDGTEKKGKPCTEELVKSHFGLASFSSADNEFANGVYECLVGNNIVHNAAVEQGATFPGAKGWSVMVPAPVTYTFDVKAGKTYYIYNFGSKIGLFGFSFKETESQVDNVEYNDANVNTPELTGIGHVAQVTVNRTFKDGVWNAAVLPFSLNKQQVDAIFGTTYSAGNEDGTQIMYFDRIDENGKITFVRHAYNTIVAGKPFIIKPAKGSDVTLNTANCASHPYVTIEATDTPAPWGRNQDKASWISSYSNRANTADDCIKTGDYYLGTSGNLSHRTSTAVAIKGFRGHLRPAAGQEAAAKSWTVAFQSFDDQDENIATSLERLMMDEDGNFFEIPTSGNIYNLSGQVVANDATKLYSLPSGIYIVNGKKYVVK